MYLSNINYSSNGKLAAGIIGLVAGLILAIALSGCDYIDPERNVEIDANRCIPRVAFGRVTNDDPVIDAAPGTEIEIPSPEVDEEEEHKKIVVKTEKLEPVPPAPESEEHSLTIELELKHVDVTVYTNEVNNGLGWCSNCNADKHANGNGDVRITLIYDQNPAPSFVSKVLYPVYVWKDNKGVNRWLTGRHSLDSLWEHIQRSNTRDKVAQAPTVLFGEPWIEDGPDRTTVQHLMHNHGLTWEQLAPYANNQDALNRIHGWKHTGRGYPPPQLYVERRQQVPAAGKVGTIHGKDKIDQALTWIRTNIGEDVKMELRWDRTGKQILPIWHSQGDWSALSIFGRYSHVLLKAERSNLPINAIGFGFTIDGDDVTIQLDPLTMEGLAKKLTPKSSTSPRVGAEKMGFFDPGSILTIFSVFKAVWQLIHTSVELTLGGNVEIDAILHGDTLTVTFRELPTVKIISLFTLEAGVKQVEIKNTSVRLLFSGSRFLKERTFVVD